MKICTKQHSWRKAIDFVNLMRSGSAFSPDVHLLVHQQLPGRCNKSLLGWIFPPRFLMHPFLEPKHPFLESSGISLAWGNRVSQHPERSSPERNVHSFNKYVLNACCMPRIGPQTSVCVGRGGGERMVTPFIVLLLNGMLTKMYVVKKIFNFRDCKYFYKKGFIKSWLAKKGDQSLDMECKPQQQG